MKKIIQTNSRWICIFKHNSMYCLLKRSRGKPGFYGGSEMPSPVQGEIRSMAAKEARFCLAEYLGGENCKARELQRSLKGLQLSPAQCNIFKYFSRKRTTEKIKRHIIQDSHEIETCCFSQQPR